MPARDLSVATDTLDVLRSDVAENGTITLQLGIKSANEVHDVGAICYFPPGWIARPADPTGPDCAQAFVWKSSGPDSVLGVRDVRASQLLAGAIKPGEACAYAPSGQGRTLYKADGTVTTYTTSDNTPDGESVGVSVGPDGIKMFCPFGALTLDKNGFQVATKSGAFLVLDADGNVTVSGKNFAAAAGAVVLGATASAAFAATIGAPGATGPTAPVKNSTSVFISP